MQRLHSVAALAAVFTASLAASLTAQDERFYERMDFGPFLSQTISSASRSDNTALKGVAVKLGSADDPAGMLFDTELLRVAAGWTGGYLLLRGTPFDGSHGPHSRGAAPAWFETGTKPGWSLDGKFEDPRPIKGHGPLPRSLGRYRGLYRSGDRVVFTYDIGGSRVLDTTMLVGTGAQRFFQRSIDAATCASPRILLIADGLLAPTESDAQSLTFTRAAAKPELVTLRRVDGPWRALPWGPVGSELPRSDLPSNDALLAAVAAKLAPPTQPASNDPNAKPKKPAPAHVRSWAADREIHRLHFYSQGDDAAQRFTVYATAGDAPPADPAQWTKLAEVDTGRLGGGGRHGVAIAKPDGGALGTFRHLLLVGTAREDRYTSLRFVAIDALGADHGVRMPEAIAQVFAVRNLPAGAKLAHAEGRVTLALPANAAARFDVLAWQGDARDVAAVRTAMTVKVASEDLAPLTKGGPARWTQTIGVKGQRGADDATYTVDTIPVPFDNPYASWMRTGGFDFFADGKRAAVSTWNGDVWVVSGIDDQLGNVTWKRYATGLFDPLGVRIVGEQVYTLGRDGITRLHDLDKDGEADFYEAFNHDVLITDGFHEFAFDLQTDPQGNFYFSKGGPVNPGGRGFQKILPHHGCIMKVSKDGETLDVYASGFRAPNGLGVGPQGQVTAGDNEGTWMPKCRLSWVMPGSFNGCTDLAQRAEKPTTYDKPLCWMPHEVDNSSGAQVWVTSDRWGPLQGELLHLSYGTCSVFKVLKETVDGQIQGGLVRLPLTFASSCMRARFNPADGQLYVLGLKGWQTSAAQDGAFQRVRYTGKPLQLPIGLNVKRDGVLVTFSTALDKETAGDPASYDVEVWNYIWGSQYGSPHISTVDPDADMKKMGGKIDISYRNSDKLKVERAEVSADGKQVLLVIPGLQPVMQMQIKLNVDTADGSQLKQTIWNTIHNLPKQ